MLQGTICRCFKGIFDGCGRSYFRQGPLSYMLRRPILLRSLFKNNHGLCVFHYWHPTFRHLVAITPIRPFPVNRPIPNKMIPRNCKADSQSENESRSRRYSLKQSKYMRLVVDSSLLLSKSSCGDVQNDRHRRLNFKTRVWVISSCTILNWVWHASGSCSYLYSGSLRF